MKVTKKYIDNIKRCYCAAHIEINKESHIIFSEEAKGGSCFEYYGENFSNKRLVWNNGGGTMSIIPLEDREGQFLAIQGFFPGFDAKESKIVWCELNNSEWMINDYVTIPYLHRFDILDNNGVKYLIGGVLCESKESREDWSSPGKIVYGKLTDNYMDKPIIKELPIRLTKNHGYCKSMFKGKLSYFFAGEEGIYRVYVDDNDLKYEKIFDKPVSDVAFIDIDGDGLEEMLTIEPFHGNIVKIYHQSDKGWVEIYKYNKPIEFAHAICSATILGKNSFIFGIRKENKELVIVQYDEKNKCFNEIEVDRGVGPANVFVINKEKEDILVSCNHTIDEAAIYIFEK